jgi:hypothetical protein
MVASRKTATPPVPNPQDRDGMRASVRLQTPARCRPACPRAITSARLQARSADRTTLLTRGGDELLQYARDAYDGPLPGYVQDELRLLAAATSRAASCTCNAPTDALDAPPPRAKDQDAVKHMRFNLPSFEDREARHAGERIEAHDDAGRARASTPR